jgi:acetyl-CoA carboxylase carboxyl transferase subunit alpha
LAYLDFEKPIAELEQRLNELKSRTDKDSEVESEIRRNEAKLDKLQKEIYGNLTAWQKVQLSRHSERPFFNDYLGYLFTDFVELHGDRLFADDPAIIAGFARLGAHTVAVIGQQKGRTTKEKMLRNFGMPNPEGYRKAMRVMELAERFGRPVLTFIDTPGAYPGIGAEERGQAEAIARCILTMSKLRVPTIATIIGEGGSGGALALGVANRVLMLEYATYSVITPEGCASILWRDAACAPEAAEQLKLLASDAYRLGILDAVISEPTGGAHRNPKAVAHGLGVALRGYLASLEGVPSERLVEGRYQRFRVIGEYAR